MWWRNFFSDLEQRKVIDLTSELSRECLWYVFSPIIQNELDNVVEHWNTHYIRKSRTNELGGRPYSLFHLPSNYGANDMSLDVPEAQVNYVNAEIIHNVYDNEYTEYFDYVIQHESFPNTLDWNQALRIYCDIIDKA